MSFKILAAETKSFEKETLLLLLHPFGEKSSYLPSFAVRGCFVHHVGTLLDSLSP